MRNYIDLVLCQLLNGDKRVCRAPAFSYLKRDEMVIVECGSGEEVANVDASISINITEEDELEFFKTALKIPDSLYKIPKVKSRLILDKLNYKED